MKTFDEALRSIAVVEDGEDALAKVKRQAEFLPDMAASDEYQMTRKEFVDLYVESMSAMYERTDLNSSQRAEQTYLVVLLLVDSAFFRGLQAGREMEKVDF